MTPGHGSYPAGHAVQAHLQKHLLARLLGLGSSAREQEVYQQLDALAKRIGENRVVAGLHYDADIQAGEALAKPLGDYLFRRAVTGSALGWLWDEAAKES
jgi:hypothetical protein